jgi:cobalt-zinc-cadmium efflux system outer membrane protein
MFRSVIALALIAACAPSAAELRRPVDADLARRLGSDIAIAPDRDLGKFVDDRLAKPLDVDGAVRIALANNARVRASLAELEIAGGGLAAVLGPTEAEVELRFGGEIEARVMQDLLGAIVVARQRASARADVAAARAMAAATAVRLAAQVELAWADLLAAQQDLELFRTAFDAADAAALLRERMHAAGNTSDLALARDRDAREIARIELARAEAAVEQRREAINGLLGLVGAQTKWTFTGRLPDLPSASPALDAIEATAVGASLDLAAGRARVDAAVGRVSEARLRTFLPHIAAGVSIAEHDNNITVGPAFVLGLPVFDWMSGARARARGAHRKASHELVATAVELRAGARAARIAVLATYAEARHLRDVVLPLRQRIVDQTVLHYNAMDADPFTLIMSRRALVEAGRRYVDALRRYTRAMSAIRSLERGVLLDTQVVTTGPQFDLPGNEALH